MTKALAGSAGVTGRTLEIQTPAELLREGEAIFLAAIEAYGRIVMDLAKVFGTAERLARIETNLQIVGDGTSLLRELLDQLDQRPDLPPRGPAPTDAGRRQ